MWKNASLVHKRCKSPRVGCRDAYYFSIRQILGFTDSDSVHDLTPTTVIAGEFQMYFAVLFPAVLGSSMPSSDSMKQIFT